MRAIGPLARLLRPQHTSRLRIISTTRTLTQSITYRKEEELDEMGKKDEGKGGFTLKVPKGTKDWDGKDMVIREKIFGTISNVFKRHGAVTIDTSVGAERVAHMKDIQPLTFRATGPCLS